jgi:uncharacterized protein (DUF342 family)
MATVDEKNSAAIDGQFDLRITEDKMGMFLSCETSVIKSPAFMDEVKKHLEKMGVKAAPDIDSINSLQLKISQTNEAISNFPIAFGTQPVMPKDGRLEWTEDFFAKGYQIDPVTKRIDFKQKMERRSVEKDQLLVRVIPPEEGSDGVDVLGMPIKVPRAKKVELRGGQHVVWDGNEKGFRATCAGRVKYVGNMVDIDEVLHITGDVGKDTGNIRHNGQVIIDGNIESDFNVEASGDIEVKGLIYASDVICGGNLYAHEGINENSAKRIAVKGEIVAKYILNATIECHGNILVKKEIFQSNIKTSGEVNCSEGRAVGGEIYAAKGIIVGEVGSKGNVKTLLVVGIDCFLLNELKRLTDTIDKNKDTIKKMLPVYKKLKASISMLTPAQKEGMMEVNFKILEAEEEIKTLEEQGKDIRKRIFANREAQIIVMDTIFPGAILRVSDTQTGVAETLLGPIVVLIDKITAQIALSSELAKRELKK